MDMQSSTINSKKSCIHSRSLSTLLQQEDSERGNFLRGHIVSCSLCQKEMKRLQEDMAVVERAIPFYLLPDDMKDSMNLELDQVTSALDKHFQHEKKIKRQRNYRFTLGIFKDLGLSFFRPSTLFTIFLGAGIIAYKTYFN